MTQFFNSYYIFVPLCVLHVILEIGEKIISVTDIISIFSAHTSENCMLRRWKRHVGAKAMHINGFRFTKIPYFFKRICIKILVKNVYQRLQNFDCTCFMDYS